MVRDEYMTRTFIQTSEFVRRWEELGFQDEDIRRLEYEIMKNTKVGPVIRGTGGLRKMRFAFEQRGKRGSVRICYVDFSEKSTVYLITVYFKKEKDNLTREECNKIKKLIEILESSL